MKKFEEIGLIILVIVVFFSAGIVAIVTGSRAGHTHYVCLELNPRIEFLLDHNHNVKSLKPLNQEAKELIINEVFIGSNIEDATEKFMELCARAGYLKVDGNNNAIKVSVLSGLTQKLELNITRTINKFFIKNNILGVVIDSSQDLQQFKDAKKEKVNFEKYDLMCAVKENSGESFEELKRLSNKKLIEKIEQSHNSYNFSYSETELNNKTELLEYYQSIYDRHIASVNDESTRKFKENLKEFRAKNTKSYKVDYEKRYNEWLLG